MLSVFPELVVCLREDLWHLTSQRLRFYSITSTVVPISRKGDGSVVGVRDSATERGTLAAGMMNLTKQD